MYRSRALLDLARYTPHCMYCDKHNEGDVVMAHSNQSRDGKSMGRKAHDYRVAALCSSCHHQLDQGFRMSREERIDMWEAAHRRTIGWLFESGYLRINT